MFSSTFAHSPSASGVLSSFAFACCAPIWSPFESGFGKNKEIDHLQSSLMGLETFKGWHLSLDDQWTGERGYVQEKGLRTLTVAGCAGVFALDVRPFRKPVCNVRSFRYSGSFLWPFYLPRVAAFTDLYICYNVAIPVEVSGQWFDNTLFNTSQLTVLTICSNALQVVSSLTDVGVHGALAKVGNFQKLKELQLIMFEMKAVNLAGFYAFLKNCHCPILESLFLQLPTEKSYMPLLDAHNDVIEEPPEDVLENLKVVKIMNFSCDRITVQLVLFLLRKANSLRELLLVAPNINQLNVSDIPDIQQADNLLLNGALANGKLVLKPDNTTPYPLHSEVFAEI